MKETIQETEHSKGIPKRKVENSKRVQKVKKN
jgi:hypothetical protein